MINTKPSYSSTVHECEITKINHLTDHAFEIFFNKPFDFTAGQHLIASLDGEIYDREYSIASAEDESEIKILVKEVEDGYFTPLLKKTKVGDKLKIRGAHGRFCIDLINHIEKDIILIATGTGIAPFRSMVKSYPDFKFNIIHGVRDAEESYFKNELNCKYTCCTSKSNNGDFKGRVTDYINSIEFSSNSIFYLCGNFDMIYDVQNILKDKGFHPNIVFTEVYF
jgi:ferredoxin/flavodoxin---NADP+ reductase